jgi:hypothetical protein
MRVRLTELNGRVELVVLLRHHPVRARSVPSGGVPPVAQALDFR